jgi:Uma2 family endonuclease
MAITVNTRKFTVDEYHLMFNAGVLTERDRTELIAGEIINMSPIGFKHASCVARLGQLFTLKLLDLAVVFSQNPVKLNNNSEPQPDLAILKYRADFYNQQLPQKEDVLLIIEVADSTLQFDQNIKIPLYENAQIPEVWIIDLNNNILEIYRDLREGKYQEIRKITTKENISMIALPEIILSSTEILNNTSS